jgi:hypothetical protein
MKPRKGKSTMRKREGQPTSRRRRIRREIYENE